MTRTEEPALSCQGVTHSYHTKGQEVHALSDVSVAAARGRVTALVGPSGSGKSTLLRVLACLERPEQGTVELDGVETTSLSARERRALRRGKIGYVFQDPADNLLDYLTVAQHLELGVRLRGGWGDGREILDVLGMSDRIGHYPRQLSGGEQQRVALAFAAAGDPAVLFTDEPTAQLDRVSAHLVGGALRRLAERGHTVLVATHDPEVSDVADDVIELVDGRTEASP